MVSIIIPIYNSQEYLAACINSVLNQDYRDIQLILVDDGSTDNSADIYKEYTDSRLRYVRKINGGVSSARNLGLDLIEEDGFVTFLDSDDYLPLDAIGNLVNSLVKSDADLSIGAFTYAYGDLLTQRSTRLSPGEYEIRTLLPSFVDDGTLSGFLLGSVCATLYKTDIIKSYGIRFDEKVRNNEDGLFNLEYAIHANRLCVIDKSVYYYRQHNSSGSSSRNKDYDYNSLILDKISSLPWDLEKNKYSQQVKARNVSLALWDILLYPRNMGFIDGCRYIHNRINDECVREGLRFVRYNILPIHKKVFAYLIRFKQSLFLYLMVKYVHPFLNSRIKR